jgi:hypothetical protein
MKTLLRNLLLVTTLSLTTVSLISQTRGNGNVVDKTFELKSFDRISAGGAFKIIITQSAEQKVVIKTDENLMGLIEVKVNDGELQLSSKSMQHVTKLVAEINVAHLTAIDVSGATDVKTINRFSGSEMEIDASGASDIYFTGDYDKMDIELSGASNLVLIGNGKTMKADISGASDLKAAEFVVSNALIEASGASDATVNVKENLNANESGASDIHNTHKNK